MELFKASQQWCTRPPDERFWNLKDALEATTKYAELARVASVPFAGLRVEASSGNELNLVGKQGVPARLTHFSFGQLADRAKFPAAPLRTLPATLAGQVLNHRLKERGVEDSESRVQLLFHRNNGSDIKPDLVLRAASSEGYERIWNNEVFTNLVALQKEEGWRPPPARPAFDDPRSRPATKEDLLRTKDMGWSLKEGDLISPAGIYASDRDMFVFLVNEDRLIDDGKGNHLARGFVLWNAEVPGISFGMMRFLYMGVCGNHIVWGAQGVQEVRLRHSKSNREKAFDTLKVELKEYEDASASEDEALIKKARAFEIKPSEGKKGKEGVIDSLLSFVRTKKLPITEKNLNAAYEIAERKEDTYGAPNTPWAIVQGLTEHSQELPYASDRTRLDRAAGKVLEIAF